MPPTIDTRFRCSDPDRPLPCYLVAEISANHNHDYTRAEAIVRAAAEAGADAVKLQTYTADILTIDCDNEYFRIKGTIWEGRTLHDLYREAYTPWEWHKPLKALEYIRDKVMTYYQPGEYLDKFAGKEIDNG